MVAHHTLFANAIRMVRAQGFNVDDLSMAIDYTPEEFEEWEVMMRAENDEIRGFMLAKGGGELTLRDLMTFMVEGQIDGVHERCLVYFINPGGNSVPEAYVQNFAALIISLGCTRAILIIPQNLSPTARVRVETLGRTQFIQIFTDEEMMINPLQCAWTPHHDIFSIEATAAFYRDNNIAPFQMARMPISDPVLKYLGCKTDRVVRIMNRSFVPGSLTTITPMYVLTFNRPINRGRK